MDIQNLVEKVHEISVSKNWRAEGELGDRRSVWVSAYVSLIHSEVSEIMERWREGIWSSTRPVQEEWETIGRPIGVGPEVAEAIIRLLDLCDIWNIDIEHELRRSIEYNLSKPIHVTRDNKNMLVY
jgi:hypothetical protein